MKRPCLPFVVGLLLGTGCGGAPAPTPAPPIAPLPAAPTVELSAAGDRAFLTIAIRPLQLPEFVGLAGGVVDPAFARDVDTLLTRAAMFDAWMNDLSRRFRGEDAPGVMDWPALDPARPIFFRFGEATDSLTDAVAVFGGADSPLRHVMAVPTTNAAQLRVALETYVAQCSELPEGVHRCSGGKHIRFASGERWVFVVQTDTEPSGTLSAESLMAPVDELAEWTFSTGVAGAFVRPALVRGSAAHEGALMARMALANASAEVVPAMSAAALAEITGAYLRSGPYGREGDALGIVLRARPLSLAARVTLSEHGATTFAEAAARTPSNHGTAEDPVQVRTSFDVDALLQGASRPFGFMGAATRGDMATAIQRCGHACLFGAAFQPVGYGSLLLEGAPASRAMEGLAHIRSDPSLPAGTIDYDARGIAAPMLLPDRVMAFRSTLDGRRWSAGLALSAEDALDARALALAAPNGALEAQGDGDAGSLRCLEALGQEVNDALHAVSSVAAENMSRIVETARSEVAEQAACVSDPQHAADRDGYLAAFAAGVPGPAQSP